jgi:alpha-tubulin suppressor-like RCC1 family protein
LGIGTFATNAPYGKNTPQRIGSDTNWQAVAAGTWHSVALRTDGTLWTWGDNEWGQLGIGKFNTTAPYGTNTPQRVGSDTNWQAVAAGFHTVALRADGTLWAWGANRSGQLGNGTFTTNDPGGINTPQQVATNSDWQTIAAGATHTVALRANGTLWTWGNNFNGQLGLGTNTKTNTPQRIGSDTNWQAIAASDHTAALRADGTLWAWGRNESGMLGIGTNTHTNTPQRVGTAANWQAVAAGLHTVALRADGTLWAWGGNYDGQLGNGTNGPYTGTNTPQQVGTDTNWGPPP